MKGTLVACPVIEPGIPKLALGYLKAFSLAHGGHRVLCFDFDTTEQQDPDEHAIGRMVNEICKAPGQFLGMTLYRNNLETSEKVAAGVKARFPALPIIYGGPELHNPYTRSRENLLADILVLGEGEETFAELLKALENNLDLNDVAGIGIRKQWAAQRGLNSRGIPVGLNPYPESERYWYTGFREPIRKMDELPYPDYSDLNLNLYTKEWPIMFSRGCPNSCSFCVEHNCLGPGYRNRSAAHIFKELYHYYKLGVRSFYIRDSALNANPRMLEDLCDQIIPQQMNIWLAGNAQLRTSTIPILPKLKAAGFYKFQYGLESASPSVLSDMRKNKNLMSAQSVVKATAEAGIDVMLFIILCYPTETEDDFFQTMDFLVANATYVKDIYVSVCGFIGEDPYNIPQLLHSNQARFGVSWVNNNWQNTLVNDHVRKHRVREFYRIIEDLQKSLDRQFPSVHSSMNGLDIYL